MYGGTKAFGYSLAETLREELRDLGISVAALLPGATDSDFHSNVGMGDNTPIGRLTKYPKEGVVTTAVRRTDGWRRHRPRRQRRPARR